MQHSSVRRVSMDVRAKPGHDAESAPYAACTLVRNCRTSASRPSASTATASASALTSPAVVQASLVTPATGLMASAPTRASPEARATSSAIGATAEFY
jgi:hypothetical protein